MSMIKEFWGKTNAQASTPSYHPAICHMIDAGNVAMKIYDMIDNRFWDRNMVGFLTSIHDIGKISPGFQLKVPQLTSKFSNQCCGQNFEDHHGKVSYLWLEDHLRDDVRNGNKLALILGGHHGSYEGFNNCGNEGCEWWDDQRKNTFNELLRLFDVTKPQINDFQLDAEKAMVFAGLTSIADWISSDQSHFPCNIPTDLMEYKEHSSCLANNAIKFMLPKQERDLQFNELFSQEFQPNDLQRKCADLVGNATSPFLMIIETPMGSGKTEAALWAADLCMKKFNHSGIFFALPTQATSNQMWGRMKKFIERRCDGYVNLTHGLASYYGDFRSSYSSHHEDGREWYCNRKRALLSRYGVGTIDQALMGVMWSRHMFVRLFGLMNKVVILDEVHAYDAYTGTLLERLVSWLAALRCTVIITSATLTGNRRNELMRNYSNTTNTTTNSSYPRITTSIGISHSLDVTETKTVQVVRSNLDELETINRDGGCAAVICNTVKSAQMRYEELKRRFPDVEVYLFHASFIVDHRSAINDLVISKFGKNGDRPRKAILVATQVIEQSLDIDFDLMLSELAPIDLLLQRMGRLHRHQIQRPTSLSIPKFIILESMNKYPYHEFLIEKTGRIISTIDEIHIPQDIDSLIENIYSNLTDNETEREMRSKFEGEKRENASKARSRMLTIPIEWTPQYANEVSENDAEFGITATRIEDMPSIQLVCTFDRQTLWPIKNGNKIDFNAVERAIRSSINCHLQRWYKWLEDPEQNPLPTEWIDTPLKRHRHAHFINGILTKNGSTVIRPGGNGDCFCLRYDEEFGLREELHEIQFVG